MNTLGLVVVVLTVLLALFTLYPPLLGIALGVGALYALSQAIEAGLRSRKDD